MTTGVPPLRPRQWELLERLITIEQRLESQHTEGDRTITVFFTNGGPIVVRPGVADGGLDSGDLNALRGVGAFDEHRWAGTIAEFRISQTGYDLAEAHRRAAGEPTAEQRLELFRQRRRALAERIAHIARWVVLVGGIVAVIWAFFSATWAYAIIGLIGTIIGIPVTALADRIQRWVADRIDRWLLSFFEPEPGATN